MTILFYVLTIVLEGYINISTVVGSPILLIFGKMSWIINLSSNISSFVVSYFYNLLWVEFEGDNIPLILLVFLTLINIGLMNSGKLNYGGSKEAARGIICSNIIHHIFNILL